MIGDKENIGFRYLKLLPTFSYVSIVVSAPIGRFLQNGSHAFYVLFMQCILILNVLFSRYM